MTQSRNKSGRGGQYPYDSRIEEYKLPARSVSPVLIEAYRMFEGLQPGSRVADLGCGAAARIPINAPPPGRRPYVFDGYELSRTAVKKYNNAASLLGLPDRAIQADITNGLDLRAARNVGAISWRVAHGIPMKKREKFFASVREGLPTDAAFVVSVCSTDDWKCATLGGDWQEGELNNVGPLMGLRKPFWIDFISVARLRASLERTGFKVLKIVPFKEVTGLNHLAASGHPLNDYLAAYCKAD